MWKHISRSKRCKNLLLFVTEGIIYMEEKGIKYQVRANECLFLEGGTQSFGYKPSNEKTGYYFVSFDNSEPSPFQKHFTLANPLPVKDLFSILISHRGDEDYPKTVLMKTLFYEILYQSENFEQIRESVSFIEGVKAEIDHTIRRNLTINEIAERFGLSREHLSRLFSQSEGITIKQYINRTRIREINNFLLDSAHTIREVSEIMGFSDEASFCKYYKYNTGNTPSEYRENNKYQQILKYEKG